MQLKTAFLSFILLICPCAFCYGQISFLGVNGERGYSAMRAVYVGDLDNDFIVTLSYEFYRQSDAPDVEKTGSTYRYGLTGAYDFSEAWRVYLRGFWQPRAVGNKALTWDTGAVWYPFYRYGILKEPFIDVYVGHTRYETTLNAWGSALADAYRQEEIHAHVQTGTGIGPWNLKGAWHKVIQYNHPPEPGIAFSWADIPFMTAIVQGFLREAAALRVSYATRIITPYATAVRYQYAQTSQPAVAVGAGLQVKWGETSLTGGVEVFEPRREETRKTFFSMSVEVDF